MAWKGRQKNDVDFNELLSSLNNSRIQQTNNALWQTLYQIITRVQQFRDRTTLLFKETADNITEIGNTIINLIKGLQDATFWTEDDQTLNFPSSIRVVAGPGITLDYTVANVVTISATGASELGYWTPLTDGDLNETDLIFAAGECIAVFVPTP